MKLKILQESLSESLHTASRFTSSRAQLPVLGNIYMSAEKNKLIVSATNLEMSFTTSIGSQVEEEGKITVPARVIVDLVTNLNPGTLSIETDKEKLMISGEENKFNVSGMNVSDFPSVPQSIGKSYVDLSNQEFLDALSKVLFAVSGDETRPILTGVLLIFKDKDVHFVATDGFRLSQKKIKVKEAFKKEDKVIIPKNVLGEITRLAKTEDIKLEIKKEDKQVVFAFEKAVLASRVIEGDFPDFERIIPKTSAVKIEVDREDLLRAVKLISVFARDSGNVVRVNVVKDMLELSAESQLSGSGEERIDAKISGDDRDSKITIAFNFRFLEEYLNSSGSETVEIGLTDSNSPGVFKDPKDPNYLHLIMPVRIQS
jgi:DNA polymerase-3 subunit beta